MQALILLTLLKLSSTTWNDAVQISWNGMGMRLCDESTPDTNACPTPTNPIGIHDNPCILESSNTGNVYYGPFHGSTKMVHEFEASCPYYGNMTLRYTIAFCGIQTRQKKVHTTISFANSNFLSSTKTNFYASSGNAIALTDASLSLAANGCANFYYSAFEFGPRGLGPILGNTPVPISVRNRLVTGTQWAALFNVSVECTAQVGQPPVPFHAPLSHDAFCVDLIPDVSYNGEYQVTEKWVNDNYVFVKDDFVSSKRYIYSCVAMVGDAYDRIWVFGVDYSSCDTYRYACTVDSSPGNPLESLGFDDCVLVTRAGGIVDGYMIIKGGCEDHYVANIFGISTSDLRIVRVVVVASLSSCILGMLMLYWCQLFCYSCMNKNYKSVANKEIDF